MIGALGIAGSPRRHGNTEILLDQFLAGAEEAGAQVDKVVVARLDTAGCIECNGCWEDGICVVKDDFQAVNKKLVESDVIALASPLFFWNVSAQVKALIDRGQSQWARKFVVEKPLAPTLAGRERRRGVFICVGGDSREYFEGAVRTVRSFFRVYQTDYWGDLLYSDVEDKGEIKEHHTAEDSAAMQQAFELGRRAVRDPWGGK
jgi:putative NADPH-quinone reductase